MVAYLADKLAKIDEADGTLLDHSPLLYGSNMGNPNQHASDPLPMVAVGGGVGKGHRHVQLAPRTPVGNLWLTVAHKYESPVERIGESNGTMDFF